MNIRKHQSELQAYRSHFVRATTRLGLSWDFTYFTWVAWWERHLGPDWFKKRGPRKNQYVMARKGDTGPYAPWNVECITQRQNCLDRIKNGKQAPLPAPRIGAINNNARLTEQEVVYIFHSKDNYANLAKKFRVGWDAIANIKRRRRWVTITRRLPILDPRCKSLRQPV